MSASRSYRRSVARSRAATATVAGVTLGASLVGIGLAAPAYAVDCPVGSTTVSAGVCEVVFTTSPGSAWTPPAGIASLEALLVGAGGAGGGSATGYAGGGGDVKIVTLATTGDVTITVGAAGTGSANSVAAQAGGSTYTAAAGHTPTQFAAGASGNNNAGSFTHDGGGAGGAATVRAGGSGEVVTNLAGSGLFSGVTDCYGGGGGGGEAYTITDTGNGNREMLWGFAGCGGGHGVAPAGSATIVVPSGGKAQWSGAVADATTAAATANSGGGGGSIQGGDPSQSTSGADGKVVLRFSYPTGTPVTVTPSPATSTITYGATTPTFTPSYSGYSGSDTAATAPTCAIYETGTSTLVTASPIPAGTYDTKCSGGDAGTGYSFTYDTGSLTVTAATTVTVTPSPSPSTINYGATTPSFSPSYTGYVGSDTAATAPTCAIYETGTSTLVTASPIPVGTYDTKCSGGDAGTGYTFDYVTGSFTVSPVTPVVKYYGTKKLVTGDDLTLAYKITPSSCTGAPTYSLDRDPTTGTVGTYALSGPSPVSTVGWLPGSYTITVSYPGDETCAAATGTAVLLVAATAEVEGNGYYTSPAGKARLGFEIEDPNEHYGNPEPSRFSMQVDGKWKVTGLLDMAWTKTAGVGSATGTATVWKWLKVSKYYKWVSQGTNVPITIWFTPTVAKKGSTPAVPATFALDVSGFPAISSSTRVNLTSGGIRYEIETTYSVPV